MTADTIPSNHGRVRESLVRAAGLAAALAVAALVMAGCGGSPASSDPGATGSGGTSGLAYSSCMRSHGVPDFPDPNSQGHIGITAGDGVNVNSPQFKSAEQACRSLQPGAGTPAQQAQRVTAALKYAKCMRSHGLPEFPDPNSQGGFDLQDPGFSPDSPQYQSASEACQHYLAGEPGGGQTVTGSQGGGGL